MLTKLNIFVLFNKLWTKCLSGHFEQDPIMRTFWCGINVSMDILSRAKYQGSLGMDQMS